MEEIVEIGYLVRWGFGYLDAKLAFSIETQSEFHRKKQIGQALRAGLG